MEWTLRCGVRQVRTDKTWQSRSTALAPSGYLSQSAMTIYINLLFNFKISFDLKGSSPATSVQSNGSAEVEDVEHESKDKKNEARRTLASPSNSTLVAEEYLEQPQWIAGVGDIIGSSNWIDKPRWSSSGRETSRSFSSYPGTSKTVILGLQKPAGSEYLQGRDSHTRTALQRHCDFWDTDGDGLIYPWDIYTGFRRLGFHFALCLWAAVTMATCASYNTHTSYIPHPLFAINLDNINSNRHGSSTGTYDMDGELDERRFEAIFQKYARGRDHLTLWSTYDVWRNQRCGLDFFGWFAGGLECENFQ